LQPFLFHPCALRSDAMASLPRQLFEQTEQRRPFLKEHIDKINGPVLQVWSADGSELARIARGHEAVIEVILDASKVIPWTSGGAQGYLAAHAETSWLRVIRACDGHSTTMWRCYRQKPPPSVTLSCDKGHGKLDQEFGASGFFRLTSQRRRCFRCGKDVKNGVLRWTCQKCDYEVCINCAEEKAFQEELKKGGASCKLEDFLDADTFSPLSSSSPSPPRNSRRRGSGILSSSHATSRRSASHHARGSVSLRNNNSDLFNRRDRQESLEGVPFLGVRPLGQIQADTLRRLRRLIRHGDAEGAYRTLARARQLDVAAEDLAVCEQDLRLLEVGGPFYLLDAPDAEDLSDDPLRDLSANPLRDNSSGALSAASD